MARVKTRSKRIESRITPEGYEIIRQAASLTGRSLSEFIVASAEAAAKDAIAERQTFQATMEEQRRFVENLLNPPAPNPALKRARARSESLIAPS